MIPAREFMAFAEEVEKLAVSADWVKYMLSGAARTPEAVHRVAGMARTAERGGAKAMSRLGEVAPATVKKQPSKLKKLLGGKPATETVYRAKYPHGSPEREALLGELSRQHTIEGVLRGSRLGTAPRAISPSLEAAELARLRRAFGRPAQAIQLPRAAERAAIAA